ncbi:hypothetical protein ACFJIY_12635 [Pimelobacter simplex]|uniref:hypothetical protein n=1 Tax=Nocardioides simplex TaxID=2045 RepID=UPI0036703BF7
MSTNTPGWGGYVLAWLISVAAVTVLIVNPAVLRPEDGLGLLELLVFGVAAGCFVAVFSVPFAAVGIAAVHFACRGVAAQTVHVAAAALAGALASVMLLPTSPTVSPWSMLVLGSATGLGRLAVVPLVWRRRDSAPSAARC